MTDKKDYDYWRATAAGILGGAAGILTTHPIDTLRVRMIKNNISVLEANRSIFGVTGFRGYWSGVLPPVTIRGGAFGLNRLGYNFGRRNFDNPFLMGCCAGLGPLITETPMHLIKCRAQLRDGANTFPETLGFYARYVVRILQGEGLKGLYRGLAASFICLVPGFGFFYAAYEPLKKAYPDNVVLPTFGATISTWLFVYPSEIFRTEMQTNAKATYKGIFQENVRKHGYRTFYRAFGPTMVRAQIRFFVAINATEKFEQMLTPKLASPSEQVLIGD